MILKRGFLIGLIALLAAPGIAFAQSASPPPVDVSGLSAAQIAEINAQIEAKRTETPQGQVRESLREANEWVDIGEGIGAGVAAAARETGQVVNEFAVTPVGKLTTFVILYKVIGKDIISFVVGSVFMIGFVAIWLGYTRSIFAKGKTIKIEGAGATRVKTVTYHDRDWSEGRTFTAFLAVVIFLIVSTLLLFVIT